MITRSLENRLNRALDSMPVVALLGPRQVGKTTLALEIAGKRLEKNWTYLDLKLESDLSKLTDAESYLKGFEGRLLIIDEVQRRPELFPLLRGLVDARKRKGEKTAQFLLLGSASRDLLYQSSESLAGRIRYLELSPFKVWELHQHDPLGFNVNKLWFRGGFPDSYLAASDEDSWEWRNDFIATYVERDLPGMGPKIPSARMKIFWTMLAHFHGQQIVYSSLGKSLEVSHTTIKTYLDILTDFYMVRQIQPWSGNTKKRLVKSPKIYLRDTGLLHKLLNIPSYESLLGNPMIGASWEGFVAENIILQLTDQWRYSYYRSSTQAEIDLVLEGPDDEVWAIEIKRSAAPQISRGFHTAAEDIKAARKFVVYPGSERFPMGQSTEAIGLVDFLKLLTSS